MDQSDVVTRPEIGRHHFLRDPDAFDREIRYFVPCQAEILDSLLESTLLMESDYSPILELGCRTGILSSRLLEEKPYVKLTAVDQDPAMLLACKERLGRAADWVETERRSIPRYSRQGAFDYVLSNLALNFLESPEDKESVCRNAFWSLKRGGDLRLLRNARGWRVGGRKHALETMGAGRHGYGRPAAGHPGLAPESTLGLRSGVPGNVAGVAARRRIHSQRGRLVRDDLRDLLGQEARRRGPEACLRPELTRQSSSSALPFSF